MKRIDLTLDKYPRYIDPVSSLFRLAVLGGGSGTPTTVDGTGFVELINSLKKPLVSLTQYGKCEQRNVPVGWTQVDYIESSGTQYIDTGIKLTSDDVVEAVFANNSATGYGGLYGIYASGENSAFYANVTYYGYDSSGTKVNTNVPVDTNWHKVVHDFVNGKLTLDGVDILFTPFSFANDKSCGVFARYYNDSYGYFFNGKVKKFVIKGKIHLIPIKNDNTNEYALYDTISGNILHNKGSDSFNGGVEVQPSPETPVDIWCNNGKITVYRRLAYLRSSGTQYIDLGYTGGQNTKVEVKYRYYTTSNTTGSGRVFGSRTNSTTDAFAFGTANGTVLDTDNKVFWCYDGQPYYVVNEEFAINKWKTVVFSATEHTVDGDSYGEDYTPIAFTTPTNLMLFGFTQGSTMGYGIVDIESCKLWDGENLLRDLIPAEYGSVVGMYDRVSGQFLTNAGTGSFTGGDDLGMITEGTPETLTVSNNWFNPSEDYAVNNGNYISDSGAWRGSTGTAFLTLITKLDEGKEYTVERTITNIGSCALRITAFDSSTPSNASGRYSVIYLGTSSDTSYTFTVPTGFPYVAVYVRHSAGRASDEAVVNAFKVYQGEYAEQRITGIPNKLGIDKKFRDSYEFVSGSFKQQIGIKVYTGDSGERWYVHDTGDWARNPYFYISEETLMGDNNNRVALLCNALTPESLESRSTTGEIIVSYTTGSNNAAFQMFPGTDANITDISDWKAYLASNPLIVVYRLKRSTTEQLEPREIKAYKGDTTIKEDAPVANDFNVEYLMR